MRCPKCLNEVRDGDDFCPRCGFDISMYNDGFFTVCPNCGMEYSEPVDTCIDCNYSTGAGMEAVCERKFAGTIGAFVFAIAGGLAYFLLGKIGFVASVSGLIGIICALKGYQIFGKKLSKFGIVISIIATVFMIILAWYMGLAQDIYEAACAWYREGSLEKKPSFGACFCTAWAFLLNKEIASSYLLNLLMGLGFAILGCWRTAKKALMRQAMRENRPVTQSDGNRTGGGRETDALSDSMEVQPDREEAADDECISEERKGS